MCHTFTLSSSYVHAMLCAHLLFGHSSAGWPCAPTLCSEFRKTRCCQISGWRVWLSSRCQRFSKSLTEVSLSVYCLTFPSFSMYIILLVVLYYCVEMITSNAWDGLAVSLIMMYETLYPLYPLIQPFSVEEWNNCSPPCCNGWRTTVL